MYDSGRFYKCIITNNETNEVSMVALAEWLRRVPAKYMGFPRESSNLSGDATGLRRPFTLLWKKSTYIYRIKKTFYITLKKKDTYLCIYKKAVRLNSAEMIDWLNNEHVSLYISYYCSILYVGNFQ